MFKGKTKNFDKKNKQLQKKCVILLKNASVKALVYFARRKSGIFEEECHFWSEKQLFQKVYKII